MASLKIKKAPALHAEIFVPGDKSMSHRAAILGSLSNGTCVITRFLPSEDCMRTVEILRQLGVPIEQPEPTTLIVHGIKGAFRQPDGDLYCGNSGTTMRLMAGLLAGRPLNCRLTGDASLSLRPMDRVVNPLREMGADISLEGDGTCAPITTRGARLKPIHYRMPMASAQVKSALLLAGLSSQGKTTIEEPFPSRDHTERMLEYFLVTLSREGEKVSLYGDQALESRDFEVPGDISSAAFWMVAAAARPGARLLVQDVGLNDTRTGILNVLVRMGAKVREIIEEIDQIERMGAIEIHGTGLKGTTVAGRDIPNVIDELPVIAVAGALAEGTTRIADAGELRVKETDRIAAIAANLQAMGASVREYDDGLEIHGGRPLKGAHVDSYGDHRIAMAFAIAGLFAEGETVVENSECIATSYPGFEEALRRFHKPGLARIGEEAAHGGRNDSEGVSP